MSYDGNGFILRPEDLGSKILEWKQRGYHVLSPAIQVSTFAPGYGVNASMVLLDPNVDEKGRGLDVYRDDRTMQPAERGLAKIALGKIAAATGVSWIPSQSGRKDPLTIQNLWIYQVLGVYLAYDGTPQTIHGEKEIDYRDGSAQIGEWSRAAWREALERDPRTRHINGWSDNRVMQARSHGAERAETGAMERAIRMGFGIKHIYTVQELAQPFVALRVCPVVDMSDPRTRALVTDRQLAGVAALYAGPSVRSLTEGLPNTDFIDVGRAPHREPIAAAHTPPAAAPAPTQQQAPPPAQTSAPPPPTNPAPTNPPPAQAAAAPQREPGDELEPYEPSDEAEVPGQEIPEGATLLRDVKVEEKPYTQAAKRGRTFRKWTVVAGNGDVFVTVFPRWGERCAKAFAERVPVVLRGGPENNYHEREIIKVLKVGERDEDVEDAPPRGSGGVSGGGGATKPQDRPLPMDTSNMRL
jgi:hypothetical protein